MQLIGEMSTLFPDSVLHIGGDETGTTPPCDMADTKSFEVKMIDFVRNTLGKEVHILARSRTPAPRKKKESVPPSAYHPPRTGVC